MEPSVAAWDLVERLGDDEVVVVDIRRPEDSRRVPLQIPGAIRMTLQEIHDSPHTLPDDELIVLYDGDGGFLARRALRILQLAGRSAAILEGGLQKWLSGGYPTETVRTRYVRFDDDEDRDAAVTFEASMGDGQ
ncbi:MAG: rhodanese-like domain-containing protein [Myxococcaceae bacterium]|nr:rhodanese-like domain-containing protein [Myxococcaceae bacterium]